jgi:hypothetical protein
MPGGRHRERAFRDPLADLLPPLHGFGPTIRIGHFEVQRRAWTDDAFEPMRDLLSGRHSRGPDTK